MAAKQSDDRPARAAKSPATSRAVGAAHDAKGAKAPPPSAAKTTPKKSAKAPAEKKPSKVAPAAGDEAARAAPAAKSSPPAKSPKPKEEGPKAPAPKKEKAKPPVAAKPAKKPGPILEDEDFVEDEVEVADPDEPEAAVPPVAEPPRKPAPRAAADQDEDPEEDAPPEDVAILTAPKKKVPLPIPPMPPRRADGTITVAYSPDADDAFMLYALESGKVDTEDRRYACTRADIQVLNDEAKKGTYDVTALSFGAYPDVNDRYSLLPCGGSFGDAVGPILVAKTPVRANEVNGLSVAVPGLRTTATMVLRLWLPRANLKLVSVPFDQVGAAIKSGKTRAGVLIHEAQLTWREDGLVRIADFGQWWGEKTEGLPLPLGGNAIRRDIAPELRAKISLDLKRSIAYALGHREEAVEYALKFARGLDKAKVDKYVSMYVNELTLDVGERGRQAVRLLLDEAHRAGLLPKPVDIEFA
jgi:1,4-dihydroxy-6-naphthoate synthase